jgi:hypothetical protein
LQGLAGLGRRKKNAAGRPLIEVRQCDHAVGAAAKGDPGLAVDALVCFGDAAHAGIHSIPSHPVLLDFRSLVFMIAFPHDTPSTSNAPCPYVKRPVPPAAALP